MSERRVFDRRPTPGERQALMVYGRRRHLYGKSLDESSGGVGVKLRGTIRFEIGEHVLVHHLHESQVRVATIRHVDFEEEADIRLGLQWCDE